MSNNLSTDATDSAPQSPARRPNILMILCDDMGFSDIGCFGAEIATPNLDRLASRGLRMSSFYNCARCCPTRASLLTGVYPHQAGVGFMVQNKGTPAYQGYLRDDVVTLAEVLKPAGYFTGYSGKWHSGGTWRRATHDAKRWRFDDPTHPTPMSRGFERFYGNLAGGGSYYNIHLADETGLIELPENFYTTDHYTSAAMEMMRQAGDRKQPFFVHLCYNAPHWPLHALPEDIERYRGKYSRGWDTLRTARHEELKGMGIVDKRWDISPRDEQAPPWTDVRLQAWEDTRMATYAAMVDRVDQNVGRIVADLEARGELDNTLILFFSDNGGCAEQVGCGPRDMEIQITRQGRAMQFGNIPGMSPGAEHTFMSYDLPWANASNAPFRRFKHWVHEGGIATPFVAHWPRGIASSAGSTGAIRHEPAHLVDLVATIYDLAEAPYPETYNGHTIQPLEGESFAALLAGKAWQRQQPIGWEHEGNSAWREGDLKLVRRHKCDWELYDLSADRTELSNLAARHPEKTRQLAQAYETWATRCGVLPFEQVRAM